MAINPYNLRPEDINGDGLLDLPKVEQKLTNASSKDNVIITWYNWNGQQGDKEVLAPVSQYFYSFAYNHKLHIPDRMRDKIYIKIEKNDENYDYSIYYITSKSRIHLLTYTVMSKSTSSYENKDKNDAKITTLFETDDYVCILKSSNSAMMRKYGVDIDRIKNIFEMINN